MIGILWLLLLAGLVRAELDTSRFMINELSQVYPLPDLQKDPLKWFQHREWLYSLSDMLSQKAYLLEIEAAVTNEQGHIEARSLFDLRKTARERALSLLNNRVPNVTQRKVCLDLLGHVFNGDITIELPYKQLIEVLLPIARLLIRDNAVFTAIIIYLEEEHRDGMVSIKLLRRAFREFIPPHSLFGQALGDRRFGFKGQLVHCATKLSRRRTHMPIPVPPPMPLFAHVMLAKKVINGVAYLPATTKPVGRNKGRGTGRVLGYQGGSVSYARDI